MPPNAVAEAIGTVLSYGVVGAVAILFGVLWYKKDKELTEQSKDHTATLQRVQREVLTSVTTLGDLFDGVEKQRQENEAIRLDNKSLREENARLREEVARLEQARGRPRMPTGGSIR